MLVLDLGVFHREARIASLRESAAWTSVWVALSLAFAGWVWHAKGPEKGLEFLTGYVIEYSLSVDNIFVFVLVFSYFAVPKAYEYRVLFWGILAALIMRGGMIGVGCVLIEQFGWIMYLFGAFLIYTGVKMLFHKEIEVHPERNPMVRMCRWLFPITSQYEGSHFFVRRERKLMATPLLVVFGVINFTDLVFAVDSIPAIFAITTDPFIVYSSNICAILGLRSLYFLVAGVMGLFVYLQAGIAVVLTYIGLKMLLVKFIHIPTSVSLGVIGVVLAVAVVASLLVRQRPRREGRPDGQNSSV